MNTLKYKGYIGSVAYSEPDKVFFGKLEGIDDLVNYEGESVAELTAAFQEAVEDYLAFCEGEGVKPEKSYSGSFNVRISPDTHRSIARLASEAGVSINSFVKKALAEAVDKPVFSPSSVVGGYGVSARQSAVQRESSPLEEESTRLVLNVPKEEARFAKELFGRLGWKEESL